MGIVVVVCCGGALTGGIFLFKSVQSATGPAHDSVDTFLDEMTAGQTEAAYEDLCSATRQQFTTEQFTQIVDGRPKIVQHSITGTNVSNFNGHVSAAVNAELRYADGSSDTHLFQLTKEDGAWRICGRPY
uniref:Rv0361 family membrane protein n=1 Tax=Rugosimonospora acidiphila TaxID=556531 RepID=UPI0031F088C9